MASSGFWNFVQNYRSTPYRRMVPDQPAQYEARGYGQTHNDYRDTSITYHKVKAATEKLVEGTSYQKRDPRTNVWSSITRDEYEQARTGSSRRLPGR